MSEDRLLDGRVVLRQPDDGYRAAIDPVFLAAAVPAQAGETVLDAGCGSGAAALCLAARCPGVRVSGLELQAELVGLAAESAGLSGLADRVSFTHGDILTPPDEFAPDSFDHVMANPPYLAKGSAISPPTPAKALAHMEGDAVLADWVAFCLARLKPGGTVTFVHRFDRRDDVVSAIGSGAGDITVFPLWPKEKGTGAKRVIVQGVKGGSDDTRIAAGMVLHQEDGSYTEGAARILRAAEPVRLTL